MGTGSLEPAEAGSTTWVFPGFGSFGSNYGVLEVIIHSLLVVQSVSELRQQVGQGRMHKCFLNGKNVRAQSG